MRRPLKAQVTDFPICLESSWALGIRVPRLEGPHGVRTRVSEAGLHLAISYGSGSWAESLCQEQRGRGKRTMLVRVKHTTAWERNPELSLWASPPDGLRTAAVQCGKEGNCWSPQSGWLIDAFPSY